mmetsp:Transcript_10164/g.26589  ORF Transcript_10164/g.26589 Transcript_10164/m.26589 type:complete len:183 (-) Transcript_10164:2957-3505(-)
MDLVRAPGPHAGPVALLQAVAHSDDEGGSDDHGAGLCGSKYDYPIKPRARVHRPPPRREWVLQSFTPAIANPLSPPATHKQTTNVLLVTCTAVYLPKGIKVTTKEWQAMVSDAYIWMDYMSVPQIGTYLDAGVSDLMKAVESIPAYGELSVNQRYRSTSSFVTQTPSPTPAVQSRRRATSSR